MRPQLVCDERTQEVARILLKAPAPSALARPLSGVVMQAGIDLLRLGAAAVRFSSGRAAARLVRTGAAGPRQGAGASMRNGSLSARGAAHHSTVMSHSRYR